VLSSYFDNLHITKVLSIMSIF